MTDVEIKVGKGAHRDPVVPVLAKIALDRAV
jgi:hypothetical protein